MTHTAKFAEKFNENFNGLDEETRNITLQRIKDVNHIAQDEDISASLPGLLTQDLLLGVIDDNFRAAMVLDDLVENGIPHKHIEENDLTEEQAVAFHAGIKLARNLYRGFIQETQLMDLIVTSIQEVLVEEEQSGD